MSIYLISIWLLYVFLLKIKVLVYYGYKYNMILVVDKNKLFIVFNQVYGWKLKVFVGLPILYELPLNTVL